MGNQQNPDNIYVPPGVNRRYPLESKSVPHRIYYASADSSGPESTWTVYSELYDTPGGPPIEGSQSRIAQFKSSQEADEFMKNVI